MTEFKLTAENYFSTEASQKYMSVSQFKTFCECPARAIAEINGDYERPNKDAFTQGHYIEAGLIGDLSLFSYQHPELISTRGASKGGLLKKYQVLDTVIETAQNDEFFMSYMEGEYQVVKTGFIAGVPFKIMMDINHPERIVDLKGMKDFQGGWKDGSKMNFIEFWGYDIQGAVYQSIECGGEPYLKQFFIAALTKQDIPDKAIIEINQEELDYAMSIVEENAPAFQMMKDDVLPVESCGVCDYCRSTKKLDHVITMSDLPV